jgi:uncharacterized SAM-binding protein YcdF (DUF218 family)
MFTTLELARQGRVRVVVLGGAKYLWNGAQRPDNELVAAWIRAWRLPTGELHLLPICRDTHDEAVHAAELVRTRGWRSVVLVSSAYHLRRAQAAFRKAGVVTTAYGCDFLGLPESEAEDRWRLVPRPHGFHLFETWLHEVLGMAWYWWKGWI